MTKVREMTDRFWEKVEVGKPDECWLWKGAVSGRYGRFCVKTTKPTKTMLPHRVSWQLANGCSFPEGLEAMHSCDNRLCVNPDHIVPGTHLQNMRDAHGRGLISYPSRAHTHCLKGHEYTEDNIYWYRGYRMCKACRLRVQEERKTKRKLARVAD